MADAGQQQQYTDTQQREHDDAPITASKTIDPDKALVAEAVTIGRPARELFSPGACFARAVRTGFVVS